MTDAIFHRTSILLAATLGVVACQSPVPAPPPPAADPPPPAPVVSAKPEIIVPPPDPQPPKPTARLAARDPVLDEWKQRAAERIHEVSRQQLFEGRPEHLLRAVIVVEMAVDRNGKITHSRIMRSPGIASLNAVALRSLNAASPLPAPPAALTRRGALVYQETWLFRKDGRFRLRTLSLPQE